MEKERGCLSLSFSSYSQFSDNFNESAKHRVGIKIVKQILVETIEITLIIKDLYTCRCISEAGNPERGPGPSFFSCSPV